MKFKEAYVKMLEGKKVKRPCFKGHWFIDGVDGKLKIRLKDGNVIETGDLELAVKNTLAEDWEVTK